MQMIGHHDDGIDFKRTRAPDLPEGLAQGLDRLLRRKNRLSVMRHHREEETTVGNEGASILHQGMNSGKSGAGQGRSA
jgi:hypothetical protein